jgi:hypothetical protein
MFQVIEIRTKPGQLKQKIIDCLTDNNRQCNAESGRTRNVTQPLTPVLLSFLKDTSRASVEDKWKWVSDIWKQFMLVAKLIARRHQALNVLEISKHSTEMVCNWRRLAPEIVQLSAGFECKIKLRINYLIMIKIKVKWIWILNFLTCWEVASLV